MTGKDWTKDAADEIRESTGDLENTEIEDIIVKHSPFKDGVAYMPVPKCATCARWIELIPGRNGVGHCEIAQAGKLETGEPLVVPYAQTNGIAITSLRTGPDFGCVRWKERS